MNLCINDSYYRLCIAILVRMEKDKKLKQEKVSKKAVYYNTQNRYSAYNFCRTKLYGVVVDYVALHEQVRNSKKHRCEVSIEE